jgi:hypothetical protein
VEIILGDDKPKRPFWNFGTAEDGLLVDRSDPDSSHKLTLIVRPTNSLRTKEIHEVPEDSVIDIPPTKQNPRGLTILLSTPGGRSIVGDKLEMFDTNLLKTLASTRESADAAMTAKDTAEKMGASSLDEQIDKHMKVTKTMKSVLSGIFTPKKEEEFEE